MATNEFLTVPVLQGMPKALRALTSVQNVKLGSWVDAKGGLHEKEAAVSTVHFDPESCDAVSAEFEAIRHDKTIPEAEKIPEAIRRVNAKAEARGQKPEARSQDAAVEEGDAAESTGSKGPLPVAHAPDEAAVYLRWLRVELWHRYGLAAAVDCLTPEEMQDLLARDLDVLSYPKWVEQRFGKPE